MQLIGNTAPFSLYTQGDKTAIRLKNAFNLVYSITVESLGLSPLIESSQIKFNLLAIFFFLKI